MSEVPSARGCARHGHIRQAAPTARTRTDARSRTAQWRAGCASRARGLLPAYVVVRGMAAMGESAWDLLPKRPCPPGGLKEDREWRSFESDRWARPFPRTGCALRRTPSLASV